MERWRLRRLWASASGALALGIIGVVAVCPSAAAFVPVCPVREYLGVLCPGCGGTHAIIALLHGRVAEAVRLNGLIVVLLPFALWFAGESYRRAVNRRQFEWPKVPAVIVYGLAAAGLMFAVIRNIAA